MLLQGSYLLLARHRTHVWSLTAVSRMAVVPSSVLVARVSLWAFHSRPLCSIDRGAAGQGIRDRVRAFGQVL